MSNLTDRSSIYHVHLLSQAFATSKVHGFYNSEQFVAEACETFLSKV